LDSDQEQDDLHSKKKSEVGSKPEIEPRVAWIPNSDKPAETTTDSDTLKENNVAFVKSQKIGVQKPVVEPLRERIENIESDTSSFEVHHEELSPHHSIHSTEKEQFIPGSPDLRFAQPPPSQSKIKHSPIIKPASPTKSMTSNSSPIALADSPTNPYTVQPSFQSSRYSMRDTQTLELDSKSVLMKLGTPEKVPSLFIGEALSSRNETDNSHKVISPKHSLFSPVRVQQKSMSPASLQHKKSVSERLLSLPKQYRSQGSQASLPLDLEQRDDQNTYILDLQYRFEQVLQKMDHMEQENHRLHQLLQESEHREAQYRDHLDSIDIEMQKMKSGWQEVDAINQELLYEKEQLQLKLDEISSDYDAVCTRLDHTKKQSERQEKDFYLFSRKISTQQTLIK
jgi:hypothetical protein